MELEKEIKAVFLFDKDGFPIEKRILSDISELAQALKVEGAETRQIAPETVVDLLISQLAITMIKEAEEKVKAIEPHGISLKFAVKREKDQIAILILPKYIDNKKLEETDFSTILNKLLRPCPDVRFEVEVPEKVKVGETFEIVFKIYNDSTQEIRDAQIENVEASNVKILKINKNVNKIGDTIIIMEEIKPNTTFQFEITAKPEAPGTIKYSFALKYLEGKCEKDAIRTIEVTE